MQIHTSPWQQTGRFGNRSGQKKGKKKAPAGFQTDRKWQIFQWFRPSEEILNIHSLLQEVSASGSLQRCPPTPLLNCFSLYIHYFFKTPLWEIWMTPSWLVEQRRVQWFCTIEYIKILSFTPLPKKTHCHERTKKITSSSLSATLPLWIVLRRRWRCKSSPPSSWRCPDPWAASSAPECSPWPESAEEGWQETNRQSESSRSLCCQQGDRQEMCSLFTGNIILLLVVRWTADMTFFNLG